MSQLTSPNASSTKRAAALALRDHVASLASGASDQLREAAIASAAYGGDGTGRFEVVGGYSSSMEAAAARIAAARRALDEIDTILPLIRANGGAE